MKYTLKTFLSDIGLCAVGCRKQNTIVFPRTLSEMNESEAARSRSFFVALSLPVSLSLSPSFISSDENGTISCYLQAAEVVDIDV